MYIHRKIEKKIGKYLKSQEAVIITGMRRTGKTSLMKNLYENTPDNKVWFDFENPLDIKHFEGDDFNDVYQNIINFGNLDNRNKIYVFIDEAQHYPAISKIVKYLIDHYGVKFFVTGSASYYLKNLFPESLSGRKVIFELFPLDFEEFLEFKNEAIDLYHKIKSKKTTSLVEYEKYNNYYDEFVEWGGFPGVVLKRGQDKKRELLNDIFSSYYQNEIVNLSDYRKNYAIRDLILLLASRTGSQLDIFKLAQELQLNRTTIYSYLSFLQATYFITLVLPYSKSVDREVSGSQKVYFCDNGLLSILAKINDGQRFENAVFNQLRIRHKLNYYRRRTGAEIDFIADKKIAYEAKMTATISDGLALQRGAKLAKLKKKFLISKNFVKNNKGVIFGQFL